MANRPTINDLARVPGVSVATVDRVLNSRLTVREETARRVYEAANAIGYHAVRLIRQRMCQDLPEYRLGFLLQKPVIISIRNSRARSTAPSRMRRIFAASLLSISALHRRRTTLSPS